MICKYFLRTCYVFTIFIFVLLSSCGSTKDIVYFQKAESRYDSSLDSSKYQLKIANNDNLLITVSTQNPQAADIFNVIKIGGASANVQSLQLFGYLVDQSGNINFPLIGSVHLSGLTKQEAINLLQKRISEYIEEPVVNIRFLNYKISILGEVNSPGNFVSDEERVTLVQAISHAGDLTIYGNRHNVLVCRETDGGKQFYRVDLTSPDVFNSPVYYLQQNDIVYVEPNKAKAGTSTYNQNFPLAISLISLMLTIAALFWRR